MKDELAESNWFTSSYSQGGQECVEVAFLGGGMVGVRDSKDAGGPALVFTPDQWDAFASRAGSGEFDPPPA
ncbi:DUF397 domain-containing protein [Nocardia sp. 2]|uniref:DUF397 domain-containing protein n=1 Tax=Nocardia acididurans TaxID=2802282 RepID=A0ABS1M427_9NOCA|nr:DUF397 domain-containing protein [Nocardia acididurans]MBL1075335.1 DUF397 domain-containing protein [Nocardia acididurans]